MKLLVGGYMTQRYRIASSIAEDRYGIELVNTGCVPTDYKTSYGSIYNREMEREIGRRFSNVSLESILREAERLAENNPP